MPVPISNVTRRQVYAPSGTGGAGPYAFTFEILANTDIAVYKDEVLLTLTTHYTVTINANGTGSVTITATGLALSPTSPTQYAIVGNRTISRTTDFTTGGDFFANTLNDELDQQTIFAQQNAEGLQRALSAPQTDPTTINMVLPLASLRANKTLGFDATGNPTLAETLGRNRGNWASGTAYIVSDIAKDTTTNNIFQVITAHTSSGALPITTNADSAKWTLLVDAASATTSAAAAASSATAAAASASTASTQASNASTSASNASTSATNAASSATSATGSATTATTQASASSTSATAAASSATSAAASATSAAAAAASGMYSAVQDKSSAYTVVTGDAGDLIRVTTTAGAVTITLPLISGQSDGFKIAVVKWSSDANGVTVARSGSDTINGATSYSIATQYSSATFVADFETNQWFAVSGLSGATTGSGSIVLATSPTITTPVISSLSSASATALTLQSAGTTAITVDTSQNVGIGTASPADKLHVAISSGSLGGIRVQNTNATGQAALSYYNDAGTQKADIWWNNSGSILNLRTLSTDPMIFYTNNAERMRITSAGDVGIGTSSPSTKLAVAGSLSTTGQANFVSSVASPNMTIGNNVNGDTGFIMSWLSTSSASVKNWQWTFNNYSNGMSLLSSTTGGSSAFVLADTLWNVKDAGQQTITDKPAANTSAFKFLSFVSNSAEAGSITRVGTTAVVTYNTTSDYRLKKNQASLTGSGDFIDALKPKTWEWVSGGKATGFIAHEFAEVSPLSVTGEKDATQEEEYINSLGAKATRTVPLYQGMQASSSEVIANLVAELQSLRKRVALLEAK